MTHDVPRRLLFAFLAVLLAGPAAASPHVLAARADSIFASYDRADVPGCALAVLREGRIVHGRGFGMANVELGVPITPQTVFDIGSTSKQFTAACVLLLAQRGRLSLDDPVRRHIPELPPYASPITIRHLLHHTSGLRDYIDVMVLGGVDGDDVTGDREALDAICRQSSLNFPPGEEHLYSNSGYFLLGQIVQRVSGQSLAAFARENIFQPLGMTHTRYRDDHTLALPGRAAAYTPQDSTTFAIDVSNWEQTGDGAVHTTVEDLALWDRNFYEPRSGWAEVVHELQVTGTLNDGRTLSYARGLAVQTHRGLRRVLHGGAWGGYRAELMRFPEQKLSVACLCNRGDANPTALGTRVAEVYLADDITRAEEAAATRAGGPAAATQPVDVPLHRLEVLEGVYFDATSAAVRHFSVRDGRLHVHAPGNPGFELVPLGENRFQVAGRPVRYEFRAAATGVEPEVQRIDEDGGRAVYCRVSPAPPTANELAELQGEYTCPDLASAWTVRVENDSTLAVRAGYADEVQLRPVFQDAFGGPFLLHVVRDRKARVTGFTVTTRGIRGARFERQGQAAKR